MKREVVDSVIGKWPVKKNCECKFPGEEMKLECVRVLHVALLMPVLPYGTKTKWRKMSKTKAVQTECLRGLLGIRRMDKVPNVQI